MKKLSFVAVSAFVATSAFAYTDFYGFDDQTVGLSVNGIGILNGDSAETGLDPVVGGDGENNYAVLEVDVPQDNTKGTSAMWMDFGMDLATMYPMVTISADVLVTDADRHNLYFYQGLSTVGLNQAPWEPGVRLADNDYFQMTGNGGRHDAKIVRDEFVNMTWEFDFDAGTVTTYYNGEMLDDAVALTNTTLPGFTFELRSDFNSASFGGQTWIDNFSVEAVPEPATMVALGAGLLALAARRRKK